MDQSTEETTEQQKPRSYKGGEDLSFCPFKDLNLPGSYEEVVSRFSKLQGDRAMEVLN
jgi:hypothetical protein